MSKTAIAAQFIQDKHYDYARQVLKGHGTVESIQLTSLLLRAQRLYAEEKELLQGLAMDQKNAYIESRIQYHNQPLFDQLVPRQPLHLVADPMWLPAPSTLEQLCIVTGGDANYMDFIIENIEAVKNTQRYKDVAFCVLDFGLTEDNLNYLHNVLKVKTCKPSLDIEALFANYLDKYQTSPFNKHKDMTKPREEVKRILNYSVYKTCLPQTIPGYRYYLWIDADSWVQDERALDKHIVRCERQGASGSWHGSITFGNQFQLSSKSGSLADVSQDIVANIFDRHAITDGSFCIDAEFNVAREWFDLYKKFVNCEGFHWQPYCLVHYQEMSFTGLCHKYGASENEQFPYGYTISPEGFPVVCADDDILRRPSTLDPIGTPHLVGSAKKLHMIQTQKIHAPLNPQELEMHKQLTGHWFHHPDQKIVPNQVTTSIRFRVFPWDVQSVLQELQIYAQEVLCHA